MQTKLFEWLVHMFYFYLGDIKKQDFKVCWNLPKSEVLLSWVKFGTLIFNNKFTLIDIEIDITFKSANWCWFLIL